MANNVYTYTFILFRS